jgi:hypothetical protein
MSELELGTATATNMRRSGIGTSTKMPSDDGPRANSGFSIADLIDAICQEVARDGSIAGRILTVVQPNRLLRAHGHLAAYAATLRLLVRHALLTTAPGSEVRLAVHRIDDRVWIDIADHCGGIKVPPSQRGTLLPRASIGERLRKIGGVVDPRVIEARGGSIDLYNIKGAGCVWSLSALEAL